MTYFSVLSSFSFASTRNEEKKEAKKDDETSGSGDTSMLSPSVENTVLAPYNYNFN